jgi:hypothetical protein
MGDPGGDGGHLRLLETAYLLEDDIAECWMVNARDVKNTPGMPTPTN